MQTTPEPTPIKDNSNTLSDFDQKGKNRTIKKMNFELSFKFFFNKNIVLTSLD